MCLNTPLKDFKLFGNSPHIISEKKNLLSVPLEIDLPLVSKQKMLIQLHQNLLPLLPAWSHIIPESSLTSEKIMPTLGNTNLEYPRVRF